MKRFKIMQLIALTLTLLFGALNVVAIVRPFASSGNGVANFITDGAGNVIGAELIASGTATHLGQWTSVGRLTFSPDPDNPGIVHPAGYATYTASNGDKLSLTTQSGDLDVTTGVATGIFRFTGGTGRFAAATGLTSFVVTQNLATGAFQVATVGTIDF